MASVPEAALLPDVTVLSGGYGQTLLDDCDSQQALSEDVIVVSGGSGQTSLDDCDIGHTLSPDLNLS